MRLFDPHLVLGIRSPRTVKGKTVINVVNPSFVLLFLVSLVLLVVKYSGALYSFYGFVWPSYNNQPHPINSVVL